MERQKGGSLKLERLKHNFEIFQVWIDNMTEFHYPGKIPGKAQEKPGKSPGKPEKSREKPGKRPEKPGKSGKSFDFNEKHRSMAIFIEL